MKLLPVSLLRDELGFEEGTDINRALEGALTSATTSIAAMLDTDFRPGTVTDLFFIREPGAVYAYSYSTELRLSHGFVRTISIAGRHDLPNTPRYDLLGQLLIKQEKGLLIDHSTNFRNEYLTVVYEKGIPTTEVDGKVEFDPTAIPDWLKEAAKLQARIYLGSSPSFKSAGLEQDVEALGRQLRDILYPHLRYTPIAVRPL